jgi:hypothetical protein
MPRLALAVALVLPFALSPAAPTLATQASDPRSVRSVQCAARIPPRGVPPGTMPDTRATWPAPGRA